MVNINGNPNWAAGKPSANPNGRPPRPLPAHLEKARAYAAKAIDTLIRMMEEADDWQQKGWAAERLLDRAWGKPLQQTEVTANGDMSVVVRMLLGNQHQEQPAIDVTATKEIGNADD